ncbi:unnamed protein product [Strongylus vulgaris]|uniref:Uncharacterized protein n=1 Tax=Strongylus vulgaris TaxID=40348 RepID=A0A3P7LAC1_STRVU|nr:unnamed protein product [Strongylus vulgaris]
MNVVAKRLFSFSAARKCLNYVFSLQLPRPLVKTYNPVQVGYLAEECIAVDEDDNIVGGITKGDAHRVETCELHKSHNKLPWVVLPQSAIKCALIHPLFTAAETNGCSGVITAAVRKLEHELGVCDLRTEECRVMGRFLYKAVTSDALWGEHELDYAVITRNMSMDRILPNSSEVCDVRAVDEQELANWIASEPSSFSPWFLLFHRLRHPLYTSAETNGCSGVVTAAVRKLEHELGVGDLRTEECRVMGRFLYKAVMSDALWGEHELDYAIITRNMSMDRILPNPSEVCDVRAVDERELANWIASEPSSFSPWFLLFHRLRFLSEWWSNLDGIQKHPNNSLFQTVRNERYYPQNRLCNS